MANSSGNSDRLYFLNSIIIADADCSHEIKRCLLLGRKFMTNHKQLIKKQRLFFFFFFAKKCSSNQSYGFSSSHIQMWELDYKESWAPKNWCFWTVVLEKTLDSPLDSKEIQPVHGKGNQSWVFIGRTYAETETPILWPRDANWFIWKDPDAGEDCRPEEKGTTEDEMVDGITNSTDMSLSKLQGLMMDREPGMLQFLGSQRVRHDWVTELNWDMRGVKILEKQINHK